MRRARTWALLALTIVPVSAVVTAQAQTFVTLHSFDSTDGATPYGGLIEGRDGDGYGITAYGGANDDGTVFKITHGGTVTTLYSFCSQSGCTDGSNPYATLIQASDGDFYGTTSAGGANGDGTVFKITPSGTLTTLHTFDGLDGQSPIAAMIQGPNGDFYGTTLGGGVSANGTVFKMTPAGTLTKLYDFCSQSNCTDGNYPEGALIASNGDFYGTTNLGGKEGVGTVFKITPTGTLTTLHNFCFQAPCTGGDYPGGSLVQDTSGDFYGITREGGTKANGTVFKITPSGKLTTLYNFCSQSSCTDGSEPLPGLIQATDGNFYGTTAFGGAKNYGTVFKITPSGALTKLYDFCSQSNCTDGRNPYAALIQDTNGMLYGTTAFGGAYGNINGGAGDGTVFALSVGLTPFVETQPTSAKVGAVVKILGTNLTGATNVTFNGTSAVFTVVTKAEITTTVPANATTGTVSVVTPSGTLDSNLQFVVTR